MSRVYRFQTNTGWSDNMTLSEVLEKGLAGNTKLWWDGLCPNNKPAESCGHVMSVNKFYLTRPWRIIWCKLGGYEKYMFVFMFFIFLLSMIWHYIKDRSDKQIETHVSQIVSKKGKDIEREINHYFDSLKNNSELPRYINPEFKLVNIIENGERVLNATYSYTTDEEFSTEIYDFCSGCYLYSQSKSASAMLVGVKRSIDNFLKENLEESEGIHVILKGYSDGAPINGFIPYKGEFGDFPIKVGDNFLTSYMLNDSPVPIQLKANDGIDNMTLSFLRAFSIREFLDNYIPLLRKVNKKYAFYGYTENDKKMVGGKYRKVSLTLKIIKPSEIPPAPEPEKKLKYIDWLLAILSALFTAFLLKQLNYHYKHWQDRKRQKKSYAQDQNGFWIFFAATILFVAFSIGGYFYF